MEKKVKIKKKLDKLIEVIAKREGIDYNEALNRILTLGIGRYIEDIKEKIFYGIITNEKKGGNKV